MAARRLIIVLVVLFAISIGAALLAPDRRSSLLGDRSDRSSTTTTTTSTTTTTTARRLPSGEMVRARIDASAAKPESVDVMVGDQLELAVASKHARLVEIPAFGVTADAVPRAPASFNLLLREAGRVPVRDAETGALLGRIDVTEPHRDRE
jgi:hypothetical protein